MKTWLILMLFGIFMAIGGLLALANPFAATLAATTLVGLFLLLGGIMQTWLAFSQERDPHRLWHGLSGLMAIVAGVFLLANPLLGIASLTAVAGALFLVIGAGRLALAFRIPRGRLFWVMIVSGALSVLIGILVFANFAAAASTLLGALLGIQLLAEGGALIALSLVSRNMH